MLLLGIFRSSYLTLSLTPIFYFSCGRFLGIFTNFPENIGRFSYSHLDSPLIAGDVRDHVIFDVAVDEFPRAWMAERPQNDLDPTSDEFLQERKHFQRVINAFLYYRTYALVRVQRLEDNYKKLSPSHQQMLSQFPAHIANARRAVETNYEFVKKIVSSAVGMFENSAVSHFDTSSASQNIVAATSFEMEKVRTTIKQFFRDWSKEGAKEREMCYKPIIDEIVSRFPPDKCEAGKISILVPGAGLGRLAYELARLGYVCQGNEFSMFMLLGSNFILNQIDGEYMHTICPWAHQFSNNLSYNDQVAELKIPDVNPSYLPQYGLFSMAAGDFLEVYSNEEWDCVACSFFIDTAHNVIQYLEKIHSILKPGGYWINLGPLLYHFADMPGEFSIELSWEDIRRIAEQEIGFEILKEERNLPSYYIQNPNSMLQMTYNCVFLVARKRTSNGTAQQRDQ